MNLKKTRDYSAPSGWHNRIVCKCGFHQYTIATSLWVCALDVCPECGAEKTNLGVFAPNAAGDKNTTMRIVPCRWVYNFIWWQPLTWFDGWWESKI